MIMDAQLYDLLIFDLDGTLIETRMDIAVSVNFVRVKMGMAALDHELVSTFIGDGIQLLIGRALETDDPNLIRKGIDFFRNHYWDHCMDQSYIYSGVVETLDQYHPAKKMAIASNKREDFTRRMVEGYHLEKYFSTIIGGDSLSYKKPDKQVLEHILQIHQTSPERAIMIGDSATDIKAGKNANVATVGVSYGIGDQQKLLDAKPDFMIDVFDELQKIIN